MPLVLVELLAWPEPLALAEVLAWPEPLTLAEALVKPEPLVMLEGVFQALGAHLAADADLFRLASRAALLRKERLRIGLRA